jgi:ABC-type glycerol-3-phosphate transport system permease component
MRVPAEGAMKMKSADNQLKKFVSTTAGDGTVEYGTLMAYSVIAIALVITIFNAAQSGLIATLTDDAAARIHWVAAKQAGTWN